MATTATDYQHLEPRPGSNYRQLFLKGRRIRAAVVHEAIHGPDPFTPEEFAREYGVPLAAVVEALDYVSRNLPLIQAERERKPLTSGLGDWTGPIDREAPDRRKAESRARSQIIAGVDMGGIYLIQDGGSLVEMREAPYDSEALLQELLAQYPNLLAGDQIDDARPRRWLLVTREMAIPGEEDGAGRWSLDHLFLDQDAIPTLVEVKRSSDTRIRREVVGQMLDYAANAVVYWPVEEIRARFEATCSARQVDPDAVVGELVGEGPEFGDFWQKVKTNLQAGRVRMLFVADEIPTELRRVVEFLNEQMDPAVVLALEVKQFVGQGMKTLVPRVLGQTEKAHQKKNQDRGESRQWDEASFFAKLREKQGEQEAAVARRLLEWANSRGLRIWWGKGKTSGSFVPMYDNRFGPNFLFSVWTYGRVEIQFQHMRNPPFDGERERKELAQRLSAIEGLSIPEDALKKRPTFGLSLLGEPGALDKFLGAFDWMLSEIAKVDKDAASPYWVAGAERAQATQGTYDASG